MEGQAVRKLRNFRRGDAVIAFSRREVLMWRDMIAETGMSVPTVYGNLSPEVRRARAQRSPHRQTEVGVGPRRWAREGAAEPECWFEVSKRRGLNGEASISGLQLEAIELTKIFNATRTTARNHKS